MSDRRRLAEALAEMAGNAQQLEAVSATSHCVVLAGPGSGKTRTLTTAMARALLDDVVDPRGIACITYSNECALELESRLASLGVDATDRTFVGTVHSFALTQVILPYARCVIPSFRVESVATVRQQRDAQTAACRAVLGPTADVSSTWRRAEHKRRTMIDRTHPNWTGQEPALTRVIHEYERELRRQHLIDYDDMPLLAARILMKHEWVRRALQAKFPVLFVDEYQDLGPGLHELVLQLCFRGGIRLFAVGDPDQTIYGFSGADADLLREVGSRSDVLRIVLPFNYRCGTSIIDASKVALGEDRPHSGPEGTPQGTISFDPVDGDINAQAAYVMKELVPRLRHANIALEQIAALYRDKSSGDLLARAADLEAIPFVRSDGNALVHRNNRLSRLVEAMAQWACGGWKHADPPFQRLLAEATVLTHGWGASAAQRDNVETVLIRFLQRTINTTGSTNTWLRDLHDTVIGPLQRLSPSVSTEWDAVPTMMARTDGTPGNLDLPLPQFAGRGDASGRLALMTFHSAKGREFEAVVLFDMNRNGFPRPRDLTNPRTVVEERRLFYVAVTRTKRRLHLVFQRKQYSDWVRALYLRGRESGWAT